MDKNYCSVNCATSSKSTATVRLPRGRYFTANLAEAGILKISA